MNTLKNLIAMVILLAVTNGALGWTPKLVVDDPLVRMPGTQPGQVSLEAPGRCLNCHAGYDSAVEPGFNWQGSMMAHAARDFLFYSCLTVAAQDSIWAVGTPNAVDICERCHFPKGWLEGRSDPTNASAMTGADFDGVQCDFCHRKWDPFFDTTYDGTREGDDWLDYWDETNVSGTPSQPAADATYDEDAGLALAIDLFNGSPFFENNRPKQPNYSENASGQYFVSSNSAKRASFADAAARHQMLYSRYHKSKYFCGTCHDVSNPVLANLPFKDAQPGDGSTVLETETDPAFSYHHVERTFSEFMLSAYGQPGGDDTNPEFQAQGAPEITHAAKCQDCHMRDVVGVACNKKGVPVRPDESIEHPQSGHPLHDLTGGNVWVSYVLASAVPGSPNYDYADGPSDMNNEQLLNQGPSVLTLDLTQGEGIDPVALLAGVDRAKQQLLLAATIQNVNYSESTGELTFRVQNNTGHKLISGFPEGRRMFVNIRAYDVSGSLVYEVNPYDDATGTLKGLPLDYSPNSPPSGSNEVYADELVYEMHPRSSLTKESETFHFALATDRYKDNRIPPKGFDIGGAAARLSVPVWHGVEEPNYYTTEEYGGGYDDVSLVIPVPANSVEVNLYYQTTSREYIEFLRDEINGAGNLTLYGPDNPPEGGFHTYAYNKGWNPDDNNAYIAQTDGFFSQLAAWGDTIWQLWTRNKDVPGAAPFLMASASFGTPPQETGCIEPVTPPILNTAIPDNSLVTLGWSTVSDAAGYKVYYDQAGKAQLVTDAGSTTTLTDTGLTNGQEYCYKVTAYNVDSADEQILCESAFSNIVCATPQNQGQTTDPVGVPDSDMDTGLYSGKGKAQTYTFTTEFNAGDGVTIRTGVVDGTTDVPVADATVDLLITGPESTTLTTGPSNADGVAEATWNTKAAGRHNPGTATGTYTVEVKGVTASGYHWDGVTTSTTFTIQ